MGEMHRELSEVQALYQSQPAAIQRFLETQAQLLAKALQQEQDTVTFQLPDRIVVDNQALEIPPSLRERQFGSLINRLTNGSLRQALPQYFSRLENDPEPGLACAARLMRFALAMHLVNSVLPSGRSVHYQAVAGEEIPTRPVEAASTKDGAAPQSAILAITDAVVEDQEKDEARGELQVPYTPAARRFYLPRWVAFDEQGHLLLQSIEEAEACVESMQAFMQTLHTAVGLAPYLVADPVYQQKRYGMLGQLINQGRALNLYKTHLIITEIQRRASAHDLNRGLSLSLPYFDDQDLETGLLEIGVIPAGRIQYLPAFVVRAMQQEMAKVAQDTRLSASTRSHILLELHTLEQAFRA